MTDNAAKIQSFVSAINDWSLIITERVQKMQDAYLSYLKFEKLSDLQTAGYWRNQANYAVTNQKFYMRKLENECKVLKNV